MRKEKRDYSISCDKDDENLRNNCWNCTRFCFPIGCMYYEDLENEGLVNEKNI